MHPVVEQVLARVEARSVDARAAYLERIEAARSRPKGRNDISCGNLAHAFAAAVPADKLRLAAGVAANVGIVTAYNDMLSAHQPYERYPEIIRQAAREAGATAQVAGGVPAMCDGVTQGREGMELSLFSRDVIAMATGVALSHDVFDAALMLGICDKIVPGLFIGSAAFGHLPILFTPGGPMPSGLPNKEKARVRALFAEGKVGRKELLEAESASYHSPGTCTFYGTANSNQMMMETMGLHLPGAAFVNPGTPLRDALTRGAVKRAVQLAEAQGPERIDFARVIDAKAILNGVVGLLATGGSTNHTIHLVAMARAVGVLIDWDDFSDLSRVTPLLTRIYPNGSADVNHFHAAGGMAFLVRELLQAGLLIEDVHTVAGRGLGAFAREPVLREGELAWRAASPESLDRDVLRPVHDPFDSEGGLKVLTGNLGRSVIKVSAVDPRHRVVEAPALCFHDQQEFIDAFKAGKLERDFLAVIRFQGPRANGMPELHKLSPQLSVLQDRGFKVALVTDGRMSGASGKTPAAIHVTPEAEEGGMIARVRDGDVIRLDAHAGVLEVKVAPEELAAREPAAHRHHDAGVGRELFAPFRAGVGRAERGASVFFS